MDFNKSTCVALKSTYEALKIYVPGSKDYVRGRRFCSMASGFFSVQFWVYSRIALVNRSWWNGVSLRSARSHIAREDAVPYYSGVYRCLVGDILSLIGTKLGEWCVLVELVARDFWRKYCRYDEGIRLFVK